MMILNLLFPATLWCIEASTNLSQRNSSSISTPSSRALRVFLGLSPRKQSLLQNPHDSNTQISNGNDLWTVGLKRNLETCLKIIIMSKCIWFIWACKFYFHKIPFFKFKIIFQPIYKVRRLCYSHQKKALRICRE